MWVGVDSALAQLLKSRAPERAVAARRTSGKRRMIWWDGRERCRAEQLGAEPWWAELRGRGRWNTHPQGPGKDWRLRVSKAEVQILILEDPCLGTP